MEFNELIADFATRHKVENLVAVDGAATFANLLLEANLIPGGAGVVACGQFAGKALEVTAGLR